MINVKDELRESLRGLERRLGLIDDSATDCCGITLAQCHALVEIGRMGDLSLTLLADLLGSDKGNVSKTVDALVRMELVQRTEDARNRRSVVLRLTRAGQRQFTSIEDGMDVFYQKLQDAIPEDKLEQVLESLRLLNKAFSDLKDEDGPAGCDCGDPA